MDRLVKWIGIAAILAGALRMSAEVFLRTGMSDAGLQQLYFITDFALLTGIGGIYALSANRTGPIAAVAASAFLFGILVVRSPQVTFFGLQGYRTGGAFALLGIAVLGAVMLQRSVLRIAPLLWLAAVVVALAGIVGVQQALLTACTGILFALGCIAAGIEAMRSQST